MIRVQSRLPRFWTTRSLGRIQARLPAQHQRKQSYSSIKESNKINYPFSTADKEIADILKPESPCGNRIMVVVDSTCESNTALQWALSHSLQSQQDSLILLHLTKYPVSKHGNSNSTRELNDQRAYKLLCSMKNMCQLRKPGIRIETVMEYGKEKGAKIVEEASIQKASVLVLGQKRITLIRRLRDKLGLKKKCNRVAKYCIENASCMCIAIRKKSKRNGGGYVVSTKSHKDFWLLA